MLTNPRILTNILDANLNELLEFGTTASAVNHLKVTNSATTNVPTISTAGEADIGIDFENSEGEELFQLGATASAVNNLKTTNSATGDPVIISTEGENDIGISFTNAEQEEMLRIGALANGVNEITIVNAATGNAPIIASSGDDTNIDLEISSKGSGSITLTGTVSGTAIKDEDTMVSDSASHIATQQSIKAYVDNGRPYVYEFNSSGVVLSSNKGSITAAHTSTGVWTITHNFGHVDYVVVPGANGLEGAVTYSATGANTFIIQYRNGSGTRTDTNFSFSLWDNS